MFKFFKKKKQLEQHNDVEADVLDAHQSNEIAESPSPATELPEPTPDQASHIVENKLPAEQPKEKPKVVPVIANAITKPASFAYLVLILCITDI